MNKPERLAIVMTHVGARAGLVDLPWLEIGFGVDASDWIVLSDQEWRDVAGGDPVVWDALERKLLIGSYISGPRFIAVIGHPGGRGAAAEAAGRERVRRIVCRVRSLLLPATVLGCWVDEDGWLRDFIGHDELAERLPGWPARAAGAELSKGGGR